MHILGDIQQRLFQRFLVQFAFDRVEKLANQLCLQVRNFGKLIQPVVKGNAVRHQNKFAFFFRICPNRVGHLADIIGLLPVL